MIILDGKKIAEKIKTELKIKVKNLLKRGIIPKLSIILVGNNLDSMAFIKFKKKACGEVGVESELVRFPTDVSQEKLLAKLNQINGSKSINGIIVQLPLPSHIKEQKILEAISPEKDIDSLNPLNLGKIVLGNYSLAPCAPKGVIRLLKEYKIPLKGSNITIINSSNLIGKPLSMMLLKEGATMTICDAKTRSIIEHTKNADILISAVGKPLFIKKSMVKKGVVMIDLGINYKNGKPIGDVDFEKVKKVASYIAPVPGGTGPMTIAMVLENLILCTLSQVDKLG